MRPTSVIANLPWVAIVLAGGASKRWGGVDKTARHLSGTPLLLHAVTAVLPGARAVAVVAPHDHPAHQAVLAAAAAAGRPLAWTREDPPGGGPVAALAAGMTVLPPADPGADPGLEPGLDPGRPTVRAVAVLAGDLPFSRSAWPRLLAVLAADPATDAALGIDPGGHRQPLLAVYREDVLRERLAAIPAAGARLRAVTDGMTVVEVPVTAVESLDLDTPEDAVTAERVAGAGDGLGGDLRSARFMPSRWQRDS